MIPFIGAYLSLASKRHCAGSWYLGEPGITLLVILTRFNSQAGAGPLGMVALPIMQSLG